MDKMHAFSLVELLIYVALFVTTSIFLISILIIFTQVHVRQTSVNEVNSQISFLNNIIQQKVRGSSFINMDTGVPASSLSLLMNSSSVASTTIYLNDSDNIVYMKEGTGAPAALTDNNVSVDTFLVTKYENPGGHAIVQIDLVISYNTVSPKNQFSRTLSTAISRISAATFDDSILPNVDDSYDLGNSSQKWRYGYFSGGIGISVAPVAGIGIVSSKDIVFNDSSVGVVLEAPGGGFCYRLGVTAAGQITTSTVTCQ